MLLSSQKGFYEELKHSNYHEREKKKSIEKSINKEKLSFFQ
jgi:hypothetical protein